MPRQEEASSTPIRADYSNEPLYGGARFAASQGIQVQPVALQSPVMNDLMRGAAASNDAIAQFEAALNERNDFTLSMQRKAEAAQIEAAAKLELETALQAEDGSPDSFFNADHTPRIDRQKKFINTYMKETRNLARGFVTPEAQEKAQAMQAGMQSSLQPLMLSKLLQASTVRAKNAFDTNFYALLAAGDFEGAIGSLPSGFQSGAVSPYSAQGYYNAAAVAYAKTRAEAAKKGGTKAASDFDIMNLVNMDGVEGEEE